MNVSFFKAANINDFFNQYVHIMFLYIQETGLHYLIMFACAKLFCNQGFTGTNNLVLDVPWGGGGGGGI